MQSITFNQYEQKLEWNLKLKNVKIRELHEN